MKQVLISAVLCAAVIIGAIELKFRTSPPSDDAMNMMMAVALSDGCPSRAETMRRVMAFSIRHPTQLPPWWILIGAGKDEAVGLADAPTNLERDVPRCPMIIGDDQEGEDGLD